MVRMRRRRPTWPTWPTPLLAGGLALLGLVVAGAAPASAQDGGDAVVLSTGASRGFAHAGSLMGLAVRGYDPDLVVGNSMGAVIGALFAAGYDPPEIWTLVTSTDWSDLFMPKPLVAGPSHEVRFPAFRVGVDLAPIEVSRGFIPDWRVNRLLVHLLFDAQARSRGDFDGLARRYRAVTTDIVSGERVVLDAGDLPRAVRASMATPGFFSPVPWDGRVLADGGISDYLPVSVARELGAGRVAASDVSRPPDTLAGRDPIALAGRTLGLLMRNAVRDTVAPDFLLRPPINPNFSGAQFPEDPSPLLRIGLWEALRVVPPQGRTVPERGLPPPPVSFVGLEVESPDPALAVLARRVMGRVAPGPYDPDAVLAAVDRLYATGLFNGVWPRVEAPAPTADGVTLVVRLDPPPRLSLSGAAGYDNDRGGRGWAALERRTSIQGAPLEWLVTSSMDGLDRWGEVRGRLHLPATAPLAWTAGAHYREIDVRLPPEPDGGDEEVWRAGGWVGGEISDGFPARLLTLALRAEHVNVGDGPSGLAWGPAVRLAVRPRPSRPVGLPFRIDAEWRFGGFEYRRLHVSGSRAFRLGPFRSAAVLDLATVDGDPPLDVVPALGDGHRMPAYRWGEVRGRTRLIGGLDIAHPIPLDGVGRMRLRAGAAADAMQDLGRTDPWVGGVALEALWSPPIGQILVGVTVNSRGRHRTDVSVGPVF